MSKPGVAHSRAEREAARHSRMAKSGQIARTTEVRADLLAFLVASDAASGEMTTDLARVLASILRYGLSANELQAVAVRRLLRLEAKAEQAAEDEDYNAELQYERLAHRCLDTLRQLVSDDDPGIDVDEIVFSIRRTRRSGTGDQIPVE